MKLFSTDIETTGLEYEYGNKILEIGIVYFDDSTMDRSSRRYFHAYVFPGERFTGNVHALNLNRDIIGILQWYAQDPKRNRTFLNQRGTYSPILTYDELVPAIEYFVRVICGEPGSIQYTGKNFSTFDKRFLEEVPGFKERLRWIQRIPDVANLYYQRGVDKRLPDLKQCMERSGMYANDFQVPHLGLEDAEIVADLWVHALTVAEQNQTYASKMQDTFHLLKPLSDQLNMTTDELVQMIGGTAKSYDGRLDFKSEEQSIKVVEWLSSALKKVDA